MGGRGGWGGGAKLGAISKLASFIQELQQEFRRDHLILSPRRGSTYRPGAGG